MHEVSLTRNILEIALSEAVKAGAARIRLIRVKAGALAGVVPEAMEFAFRVLRDENPVTAEATLMIEEVSAGCRCRACGLDFEPPDSVFECPRCGSLDAEILRGRELEIAQLEVI